jgi:hypothetical protein
MAYLDHSVDRLRRSTVLFLVVWEAGMAVSFRRAVVVVCATAWVSIAGCATARIDDISGDDGGPSGDDGGLDVSCPKGRTACNGACVDLNASTQNCGACGNACPQGQFCTAAKCALNCQNGQTKCSGDAGPTCIDPLKDPNNCANCGNVCPSRPNSTPACNGGTCGITCNAGFLDCDGDPSNGCEVNQNSDLANCGSCGNACPTPKHATASCTQGVCGLGQCDQGWADCNKDPSDGCEVDTTTDVKNCGGCGKACTVNGELCVNSACACPNGQTICNNTCTDTQKDINNCGACGKTCTVNGQLCVNGACACPNGQTICNNTCTDTQTDNNNCGTCGKQCGNNAACVNGQCLTGILPASSYAASKTFTDALQGTTMTLAWDGTNYWSCSGGGQAGVRYAQYDANGTKVNTFSPGIDFRSVFTVNGNGSPVYAREYASAVIRQQTSPGTFTNGKTLTGGSLDAQSAVVFNPGGTEYDAFFSGTVTRWDTNGGLLGTVTLAGFGSNFSENTYPQNGRILARSVYLTYSQGNLTAWTLAGARIKSTVLTGAGQSFDSYFSLSYANGMVWVVDAAGQTWRGYNVGL